MVEHVAAPDRDSAPDVHLAQQPAVEGGQPLGADLAAQPFADLEVAPRAQVQRDLLGDPLAKPARDIVPGDNKIFAAIVLAPEHDVRVGVKGVEVIDGHPVEAGPQIPLHLLHDASDQRLQVVIFGAVLGRDDEPELVSVLLAAQKERPPVRIVLRG